MKIIRIKRKAEYLIHDRQHGLFLFIQFNFIISVIEVKITDGESQMMQKTCKKSSSFYIHISQRYISHISLSESQFGFYPSVDTMSSKCLHLGFSVFLHNTKSFFYTSIS